VFERSDPFEIDYIDTEVTEDSRIYYRIEIMAKDLHVVSNPIFVEGWAKGPGSKIKGAFQTDFNAKNELGKFNI
jgi:hypothetical protein